MCSTTSSGSIEAPRVVGEFTRDKSCIALSCKVDTVAFFFCLVLLTDGLSLQTPFPFCFLFFIWLILIGLQLKVGKKNPFNILELWTN